MNLANTDVYPSATLIPQPATTNIPIQSTTEKMEPSVTTADLYTTSSNDRAYFVVTSSSVIESTPASGNSPALGSKSVKNNPIIKSSTIIQSSQVMKSSPGYNSRSVSISVAQSTQGVKPTKNQIGQILGIVGGCSAAVVIIAVIILTAKSLHKSHVKRMNLVHDGVTNVSMAMKSFDENAPTHI